MEGGRQFSGTDPVKIATFAIAIFAKKVAKLRFLAKFVGRVVFFDVVYHHPHVQLDIMFQIVII